MPDAKQDWIKAIPLCPDCGRIQTVFNFEFITVEEDDYSTYRLGSTREGFLRVYPNVDAISLTALLNAI